jgi:hypothetical protein
LSAISIRVVFRLGLMLGRFGVKGYRRPMRRRGGAKIAKGGAPSTDTEEQI